MLQRSFGPSDDSPAHAIELKGLTKVYAATRRTPAKRALEGIDLEVPRGSFFALLGPNGAGKSTLINILAGLVVKTAGTAKVFGIDVDARPRRARRVIGVVPQELNLDAFFTPRETLELQAGLYGVAKGDRRTDEILAAVGLADKGDAYARSLSGGMRRRLLVAKALVHRPPVVILDEPTAGVDVELRRSLWAYMQELNRKGVTVILTTHYLEEAEELCDWIAIIDRGRVVACDRKESLLRQLDQKELAILPASPLTELPPGLREAGAILAGNGRLVFRYRPSGMTVERMLEAVRAAGITVADLATREADLEDVFLRLIGERSRSASPEA
jgi:ABC-2 type transport system ATP-binding protein